MEKRTNHIRTYSKGNDKTFLTDVKNNHKNHYHSTKKSVNQRILPKMPFAHTLQLKKKHEIDKFIEEFKTSLKNSTLKTKPGDNFHKTDQISDLNLTMAQDFLSIQK